MKNDIQNSLSPSSQISYRKYWDSFKQFTYQHFHISPVKATSLEIQQFITYLARYKNLAISSIRCHLAAISFNIKLKRNTDPTKSFAISRLLKTYTKLDKPKTIRKPIDKSMLFLLIKSLKNNPTLSKFYKLCYVSIFLCMYHAALRISEVAISTSDQHTLLFNCISYDRCSSLLTFNFKSYKHSNNELPSIAIKCGKRMSYYVKNYLKARGSHPGYFFCHTDHSPFSRNEIVKVLKEELSRLNYNPDHYNTHSLRIGKATDMAIDGYSELDIKTAGRWKSNAYRLYIKPQKIYIK